MKDDNFSRMPFPDSVIIYFYRKFNIIINWDYSEQCKYHIISLHSKSD